MNFFSRLFEMNLFVYGTLRPDHPGSKFFKELDFAQTWSFEKAHLQGYELRNWDGLPIAIESFNPSSRIHGFLIQFGGLNSERTSELEKLLDAYEIGTGDFSRQLERRTVEVWAESTKVCANAYLLHRKLKDVVGAHVRESEKIESGEWTMAQDRLLRNVLPRLAKNLNQTIASWNSTDSEERFVSLMGTYLVLYSCLERFGLFLFGPRKFKRKDRESLQQLLKTEYFGGRNGKQVTTGWFDVLHSNATEVLDSDTMTPHVVGREPPMFWAAVRNNSAHQGKTSNPETDFLVLLAASTLADFLTGAMMNLAEGEISAHLARSWSAAGYLFSPNQIQKSLKAH